MAVEGTDIRPVLRAIDRLRDVLERDIQQVSVEVGGVRNELASTSDELKDLRRRFNEYVEHSARVSNLQRAETKLSGLKDDLEREYGHHNVVRRTSIGTLQGFDVGNVTNKTVSQVSEELMIQTPRYWLAPALVALASWSRDDEETAKVSVSEAIRRDPAKTALFFALVLRRQQRVEASVRWLRHYLMSLDPARLSREFVVVLESINVGAFGPLGMGLASEKLADWNTQLRSAPAVTEAQVSAWNAFLGTHRNRLADNEFSTLRQLSPDWKSLRKVLEAASALPNAIGWFEQVRDAVHQRSTIAEDVLDDILERLVTEFDEEELPLRREIAYNESVIAEEGDLERARSRAEVIQAGLEDTQNVVSLQTAAAMYPENLGVGVGTQRMAIGVGRDDVLTAVGRYTMGYRSRVLPALRIELSPEHSGYASNFGFPGWSTTTQVPEHEALTELSVVWDRAIATYRESVIFRPMTLLIPGIIALVVTIFAFLIHPGAGIVALLGGAGVVGVLYYTRKTKADAALKNLEETQGAALGESERLYRAASAEYVDAGFVYRDLDAQEGALLGIVRTWSAGQKISEKGAA